MTVSRANGRTSAHAQRPSGRRTSTIALLVALAAIGSVHAAGATTHAQEPSPARARAAEAYDRGARAFRARSFAEAARSFEQANANVPSSTALASALRAYRSAHDTQRAGTVALRLEDETSITPQTAAVVRQAIAAARTRFLRVEVACSAPCTLTVDGVPESFLKFYAEANRDHEVIATFETGPLTQHVTGRAGRVESLSFEAPESATTAEPEALADESDDLALEEGENPYRISRRRFLSRPRATFFVALASTATVSGIAVWSASDAHASGNDAARAEARGASAEEIAVLHAQHARDVRRTHGFLGFTGVMVLMSGLVAGFTDWTPHGAPSTAATVDVTAQGAVVTVTHRF